MHIRLNRFVLAAAATVSLTSVANANLVTNGDFSAGQSGWVFTGNVGIFTSAAYDACCASGTTGTGNFTAFGGGDGPDNGHITQTLTTLAGANYALSFQYGALSSPAGRGTQSLEVSAGSLDTTIVSALSVRDQSLLFQTYSLEFEASGPTTTLTFGDASTVTASIDGFLDTVDVESVAEPASLLVVAAGLASLSVLGRRRSRRVGTTAHEPA